MAAIHHFAHLHVYTEPCTLFLQDESDFLKHLEELMHQNILQCVCLHCSIVDDVVSAIPTS